MMIRPCTASRSGVGKPNRFRRVNSACSGEGAGDGRRRSIPARRPARRRPARRPRSPGTRSPRRPRRRRPRTRRGGCPATTAEVADRTKASVRTLRTSTPASCAARGLPPAATSCLPKFVRWSSTRRTIATTSEDDDATRQLADQRHAFELPRPKNRKFSVSEPRGAPPVSRKTPPCRTSSIPSVAMNDGTRSRVVTTPLTRPTTAPDEEQDRDHRAGQRGVTVDHQGRRRPRSR